MTDFGAIVRGALRFAVVSLCGFLVWAVGGKMKEGVLFAACAVAFLVAAEIVLPALLNPPDQRKKFNRTFVPAFIAYAVAWSACWFALHSRVGEWLGLAVGCAVFALIVGKRLGAKDGFLAAIAVLFVANAIGYFLGGYVFGMARKPPAFFDGWAKADIWKLAKLTWGLFFGLGFGAGIGFVFHRFQRPSTPS